MDQTLMLEKSHLHKMLLKLVLNHFLHGLSKCKKCMGSTTGCGDCNRQQPGAKSKNQRDNRNNTAAHTFFALRSPGCSSGGCMGSAESGSLWGVIR